MTTGEKILLYVKTLLTLTVYFIIFSSPLFL